MFEHVLAESLGRTIRELRAGMSAREFSEWKAFYRVRQEEEQREMRAAERGR